MHHWMAYDRCGPSSSSGKGTGAGMFAEARGLDVRARAEGGGLPAEDQASIAVRSDSLLVISILRGLACSATGIVNESTPAS